MKRLPESPGDSHIFKHFMFIIIMLWVWLFDYFTNFPIVCIAGSLVQRCVVLHRDERGYGLTVSGDNPVFVQSVKDSMYYTNVGIYTTALSLLEAPYA